LYWILLSLFWKFHGGKALFFSFCSVRYLVENSDTESEHIRRSCPFFLPIYRSWLVTSLIFFSFFCLLIGICSCLFCFCLFVYLFCLFAVLICLSVLGGKGWFLVCCSFLFSLRVVPSLFLFKGYCIFLSVYPVAVNILSIMFQIVGLLIRPVYMSLLKRIWMIVLISSVCAILLLCVLFCGSSFVIFSILVLRYWSEIKFCLLFVFFLVFVFVLCFFFCWSAKFWMFC